jgi:hypothetical protein
MDQLRQKFPDLHNKIHSPDWDPTVSAILNLVDNRMENWSTTRVNTWLQSHAFPGSMQITGRQLASINADQLVAALGIDRKSAVKLVEKINQANADI